MLEEIALTPAADPLHTPFSSMRPHASQLHPILVRGKASRLQYPGTPGREGAAQHMGTSWSSPGPEGAAQSRCILSYHHCCTVCIARYMTGLCASSHHMLRTPVREGDSGRFGAKLELTTSCSSFLACLQVTHATTADWPATQLFLRGLHSPIRRGQQSAW